MGIGFDHPILRQRMHRHQQQVKQAIKYRKTGYSGFHLIWLS